MSVPHPARRYNYWLGGKDNYAADRKSGDAIAEAYPSVASAAIANREFLKRATGFLAAECGVRQFLDIGTGLPTADNTHEVAQSIAPESRIVYVDNDPLVMVHARALLTSSPEGKTAYIENDLRNPKAILTSPELFATLDLSQPVAVMLVAILHFLSDDEQPQEIVRELMDAMPVGSYLAMSHATYDPLDAPTRARLRRIVRRNKDDPFRDRRRRHVAALLAGLDLVEPGLVPVADWRPDPDSVPVAFADAAVYAALARKT
ncbi:SAM-dependent methyltransferase [Virgisporangium aurantiacum]|nr:SAM-dependent methyltransferase [Virgisporangium aurantiacum]